MTFSGLKVLETCIFSVTYWLSSKLMKLGPTGYKPKKLQPQGIN